MKRHPFRAALLIITCLGLSAADDGWIARARANEKNHPRVKAAFRPAVARASAGTVRIVAAGKQVALGTVVGADGYIVSKASLLEGKLTCRLKDGRQLEAKVVGVDEQHDLALLQVADDKLTPVTWRSDHAPPGSLVAAVGTDSEPLAVGVVSADPRPVAGTARPRGWLGIVMGEGEDGLEIASVAEDSAAEKAGIEVSDRIVRIDETDMRSYQQVVRYVGGHGPGDTLKLQIKRGDEQLEISATLRKSPNRWDPRDQWGGGPFSERRWGFPTALPHDAYVPPNACGGPLVDTDGKAVGINIARALRVVSFAIPAATVQEVVKKLRKQADKDG